MKSDRYPHKGPYGTISYEECFEVPEYNAKKYLCRKANRKSYSDCGDCCCIDGTYYCQREWLKPKYLEWGAYYKCPDMDINPNADDEQMTFF